MKVKINWSKVFLDIYPGDMVKQFKRISIPLYLSFSLLFLYILKNSEHIFLSKNITLETVFSFYFILPILLPLLLIGLFLSSIHILRHNNIFILYQISLKYCFLYGFSFGLTFFSFVFLIIYGFIISNMV